MVQFDFSETSIHGITSSTWRKGFFSPPPEGGGSFSVSNRPPRELFFYRSRPRFRRETASVFSFAILDVSNFSLNFRIIDGNGNHQMVFIPLIPAFLCTWKAIPRRFAILRMAITQSGTRRPRPITLERSKCRPRWLNYTVERLTQFCPMLFLIVMLTISHVKLESSFFPDLLDAHLF